IIHDDADRYGCQDGLQPAFGAKCLHEGRLLQSGNNFWCDTSTYEHPTSRHHFQCEIPSFCPIERHTEVECLHTEVTCPSQSSTGDGWRGVHLAQLFREPSRFNTTSGITQKGIDIVEPRSREDTLPTHVRKPLLEILEEFYLQGIIWRKTGMAAFRSKRPVLFTVPVEAGFAQTCPSGNHRSVALGVWRALIQNGKIVRGEHSNAVCIGFEVINEPHRGQPKLLDKLLDIHHPGQINGLTATVSYWPSNAKTGVGDPQVMFRDECTHNVVKAGRSTTWKRLF